MDTRKTTIEQHAATQSPIVVGGIGGSGTRVLADLLLTLDINIGYALNNSHDHLWFTLLFRRSEWQNKRPAESELTAACSILSAAWAADKSIMQRSDVVTLLRKLASGRTNFGLTGSRFTNWQAVADDMMDCRPQEIQQENWGWKEPNSHLFLPYLAKQFPNMKYIHLIRNGFDMAYSQNQNQLNRWEKWFTPLIDDVEPLPKRSFNFWNKANSATKSICETVLADQHLWISYEDMCLQPKSIARELAQFLNTSINTAKFNHFEQDLDNPVHHRNQSNNLNIFENEDFQTLKKFGYHVAQ